MVAMGAMLAAAFNEVIAGMPELSRNASAGLDQIQTWLHVGPFHVTQEQINGYLDSAQQWLDDNYQTLANGVLSTAATAFEVVAGATLVLFVTFFFLRDGARIWAFLVRLFPNEAREPLDAAGQASWRTLAAYVRATMVIALINAACIGLTQIILDVPLALPLTAFVFLTSFIPLVGATISGVVAALVTLVVQGPTAALVLIAAVIVVHQIEGHLLQPFIMGRALALHPLAVILGITAGSVLAGIFGALIAVPVIAVLDTAVRQLITPRNGPTPHHALRGRRR